MWTCSYSISRKGQFVYSFSQWNALGPSLLVTLYPKTQKSYARVLDSPVAIGWKKGGTYDVKSRVSQELRHRLRFPSWEKKNLGGCVEFLWKIRGYNELVLTGKYQLSSFDTSLDLFLASVLTLRLSETREDKIKTAASLEEEKINFYYYIVSCTKLFRAMAFH